MEKLGKYARKKYQSVVVCWPHVAVAAAVRSHNHRQLSTSLHHLLRSCSRRATETGTPCHAWCERSRVVFAVSSSSPGTLDALHPTSTQLREHDDRHHVTRTLHSYKLQQHKAEN